MDHFYPYPISLPSCEVIGKENLGILNFNALYARKIYILIMAKSDKSLILSDWLPCVGLPRVR